MCVCETIGASSRLRLIREAVPFARMLSTLDLIWGSLGKQRGGNGKRSGYVAHVQLQFQVPMSLQK